MALTFFIARISLAAADRRRGWAGAGDWRAGRNGRSEPVPTPDPRPTKFSKGSSFLFSSIAASGPFNNANSLSPRKHRHAHQTDKQPVLDDARDRIQQPARRAASGIRPRWASTIQWPPSVTKAWPSLPFRTVIGPETPLSANALPMARWVAARPNGMTSTGSGKRPSTSTHFEFVGDHDHAIRRRGDDLFAQQRAAAALDDIERRIDFIGAIDGQIEPVDVVERGQLDAASYRVGAGRFRGRHADHVKPGADPFAQKFDEMFRGRTGAEAELHAVAHMLERAAPPPAVSIRPCPRANDASGSRRRIARPAGSDRAY